MKQIKNLKFAALAALTVTLLFQTSPARAGNLVPIRLTFEKSFADYGPAPYLFHLGGSFGGDFSGTLYTGVLVFQPIDKKQQIVHLEADYVFTADDGVHSFTVHVEGNENLHTGTAVMNGAVTVGAFTGAQAQLHFEVVECPTACFQGTLRIMPATAD